jgi:hypothetical protein
MQPLGRPRMSLALMGATARYRRNDVLNRNRAFLVGCFSGKDVALRRLRVSDGKALQSTQRSEATASQDAGAETPRCAESQSTLPSAGGRRRDSDRAVVPRTDDARDQLVAMSEVLHAISRSKFELSSVLESVAEAAARLCRADGAVIFQLDGGLYRFAAGYSLAPAYREIERQSIIAPGPGTVVGRAAISRRVIRIDDLLSDPHYELTIC